MIKQILVFLHQLVCFHENYVYSKIYPLGEGRIIVECICRQCGKILPKSALCKLKRGRR